MKLLRLPTCPYCEARFLYGTVYHTKNQGRGVCPHCKREFVISFQKQRIVYFAAAAAAIVAVDLLLLWIFPRLTMTFLFLFTAILLILSALGLPFVVRYQRLSRREEKRKKKENNDSAS